MGFVSLNPSCGLVADQCPALSLFARVPQAQHIDGSRADFMAHLIVPNEYAADVAWLELFKSFAQLRVFP